MKVNTVTVIGANGKMGLQISALFAAFGGAKVYMVSRTKQKSIEAVDKAISSIRSSAIKNNLISATYDDLPECLKISDWVIESVQESYEAKESINRIISRTRNNNRIITTNTSGLSLNRLAEQFNINDRKKYFGAHFFNPPSKMTLCELIPSSYSDFRTQKFIKEYLTKILLRTVVEVKDKPAFLANRIGFMIINKAAQYAEKYKRKGGILYIDTLLGKFTGRSIPPLATVDFIGLDVHKAIVTNLAKNTNDYFNSNFELPKFLEKLIKKKHLGNKSLGGLYKTVTDSNGFKTRLVYDIDSGEYKLFPNQDIPIVNLMRSMIHNGEYEKAYTLLMEDNCNESNIIIEFLLAYISYSYSLYNEVTNNLYEIDRSMISGYGWAPPVEFIRLFGGPSKVITLLHKANMPVPIVLKTNRFSEYYNSANDLVDGRPYFKS